MRILLIILMIFVVIAAYILGGWFTIWLSKVTKLEEMDYDRQTVNQYVGCLFFWPFMMIILIPYSLYYFVKSSFIFFYDILSDAPKNVCEGEQTFEDEKKIEI